MPFNDQVKQYVLKIPFLKLGIGKLIVEFSLLQRSCFCPSIKFLCSICKLQRSFLGPNNLVNKIKFKQMITFRAQL